MNNEYLQCGGEQCEQRVFTVWWRAMWTTSIYSVVESNVNKEYLHCVVESNVNNKYLQCGGEQCEQRVFTQPLD